MHKYDLQSVLKETFGFDSFRPFQREIVENILDGRDTIAIMPTSGGKSLCFQLPSKAIDGVVVIVSPLISLMKDQVDSARINGFKAAYINSSLSGKEIWETIDLSKRGEIELLYLAPERIAQDGFLDTLGEMPISLFAIDEAHCISEWGHDFRPDYLSLSSIPQRFPKVPVSCFTASATQKTQQDIVDRIGLRNPFVVRASFNRENLIYEVVKRDNTQEQIKDYVEKHKGEPGIIYRTTRDSVEATASHLQSIGIKALPYHARMTGEDRARNQDLFRKDEIEVIVATVAFGLGIDKPNIRYVLHADLPKTIESYYQETGRAGRDGQPAHCTLLFSKGDIPKANFFMREITDEMHRRSIENKFKEMIRYATTSGCRRQYILQYFGESLNTQQDNCCDICLNLVETIDVTEDAKLVLNTILQCRERFGRTHIVGVITGSKRNKILEWKHNELDVFAVGADKHKEHWYSVIDQLEVEEAIRTEGEFPQIRVTSVGRSILRGEKTISIIKEKTPGARRSTKEDNDELVQLHKALFSNLKKLRAELAREMGLPAFVIFHDSTLKDMLRVLPTDEAQFLSVSGVGKHKAENYGAKFLRVIKEYVEESPKQTIMDDGNNVGTHASTRGKNKDDIRDEVYRLLEEGILSNEEIAERVGISVPAVWAYKGQLTTLKRSQPNKKACDDLPQKAFEVSIIDNIKSVLSELNEMEPEHIKGDNYSKCPLSGFFTLGQYAEHFGVSQKKAKEMFKNKSDDIDNGFFPFSKWTTSEERLLLKTSKRLTPKCLSALFWRFTEEIDQKLRKMKDENPILNPWPDWNDADDNKLLELAPENTVSTLCEHFPDRFRGDVSRRLISLGYYNNPNGTQ